jgi:hypothetical protein
LEELDLLDDDDGNDDSDATLVMDDDTPVIVLNNKEPANVGVEGLIDNDPPNVARAVPPVPRPQERKTEQHHKHL